MPTELSRAQIEEAVNKSLRRLQTDYIDLYPAALSGPAHDVGRDPVIYRHQEGPSHPIGEILESLQGLVKAGKVRHVGLSNEARGAR